MRSEASELHGRSGDARTCPHRYEISVNHGHAERSTWRVIVLTAVMMVVEITAGTIYGSMALLADGWHMATHVAALGIAAFAYGYARRYASSARYSFGTGKIGVLAGFASAVALAVIALLMGIESIGRLVHPALIHFNEAMLVAAVGLVVNLASAMMLGEHDHDDHNLRAAYVHVLADALTSVLAIAALVCGKMWGWVWMDPVMGLVGGFVIISWSVGLLRDTSYILLDGAADRETIRAVRDAIETDGGARVSDLHVWHIAPQQVAAIVVIESEQPHAPAHYQARLEQVANLAHVTVEVNGPRTGTHG